MTPKNLNKQQAHDMIIIFRTQCESSNMNFNGNPSVVANKETLITWLNTLLGFVDNIPDQYYDPNTEREVEHDANFRKHPPYDSTSR